MLKSAILLVSLLSLGCQMNKNKMAINWQSNTVLPDSNKQQHIGVAGPITGIINNKLIIAGGANFPAAMPWDGGAKTYEKDVYIYDIEDNGHIVYQLRQGFQDSLAYAANVSVANKIYSVGGERNGNATADVFIYYLEGDKFIRQDLVLPNLPIPLTNGSLTHLNNVLYFIGGENADTVSNKIYALDLYDASSKWTEFLTLPNPITHTIVVNDAMDKLYIVGGRKRNVNAKSDIYKEVYQLDVNTKNITSLPNLPEQLAAGTGIFYKDNILVFGGDNASTFHQVEELIAEINMTTDEVKKKELTLQKNNIQSAHPGFSKKVWRFDLDTKAWLPTDEIVGDSPVTTTALIWNDLIVIPSGEIRAGVRTNQILSGKIK